MNTPTTSYRTVEPTMARGCEALSTAGDDVNGAVVSSNLDDVLLLDFFSKHARPTFILDLKSSHIVYQNDALESCFQTRKMDKMAFQTWAPSTTSNESSTTFSFGGSLWNATQFLNWMVVSACCQDPHALGVPSASSTPLSPSRSPVHPVPVTSSLPPFRHIGISASASESEAGSDPTRRTSVAPSVASSWRTTSDDGTSSASRFQRPLDWTRNHVSYGLTPHIRLIQDFAWDLTPVGAMSAWPETLRQVVLAMMSNSDPRIIMWGEERRMIYNEACSLLFGQKHPLAMGARAEEVWAESWHDLIPIIRRAEREGKSTKVARMPLTMRRHGYLEETFWTLQMIPLLGPNSQVVGVLDEFVENTQPMVAERRRRAAIKINTMVSQVDNMEELCSEFIKGLEACPEDIPFAMIYNSSMESDSSAVFRLAGSMGIAAAKLPSSIDLAASEAGQHRLVGACRKSWQSGGDVVLSVNDGNLIEDFAISIQGRAYGDRVKTVCVLPITNLSACSKIVSILVVAMTPRRPFDEDSMALVHYLRDVFIRSASAILLPEEQRRAKQNFEAIETSLSQQLRATALEAQRMETRFAQMAHSAPVAMYAISKTGQTIFYNDAYLSITGISKEDIEDFQRDPAEAVHPDDRERVQAAWTNCMEDKQPFTCEYRVCKPRVYTDPGTGEEYFGDTWVFTNAMPEVDEHGELDHVRGWLLDISDRKEHERLRVQRVHDEQAEARFVRLAETAPLGMYLLHIDGRPIYLNDAYFELLGFTRSDFEEAESRGVGWADRIEDDDKGRVTAAWLALIQDGIPLNLEYRIKKPWKNYDTATGAEMVGDTWLQGTAVLELDEEGNPIAVQGFVTDISLKKFSERLLTERLDEALETKQQADRFIDMVSHEIRNPLSAILQSADGVLTCLESCGLPILSEDMTLTSEAAETIVDLAQTIILCAQHQKRIVDDILTLSKLDSNLLVISPDRVSPPSLLEKTIKMYEAELARSDISASLILEESYMQHAVDEVMLDSSRLLQVVINLFTNALKFTQYSDIRELKIYLSASSTRPQHDRHGNAFIEPRPNRPDHSSLPEWGNGDELYIQIAVQDSGRGLAEDELKLLFQRFQQASPKTYKQYGGSGLGLFISRELSELQGGQIGVYSEFGKGSTFSIYVKGRRCVPDVRVPLANDRKLVTPTLNSSPVTYARAEGIASADSAPSNANPAVNSGATGSSVRRESTSKANGSKPYLGPLHVLVVEDNLVNQRVMAQQLRRLGCTVHVADHGVEALEFLQRTTFWDQSKKSSDYPNVNVASMDLIPLSVVLMDLEMPVLGGLGCVKRIRELQEVGQLKSHVPVIAVTANARSEQIAVAIDHGMDSVVTKPFRIPELVPQMQSLVARVNAESLDESE